MDITFVEAFLIIITELSHCPRPVEGVCFLRVFIPGGAPPQRLLHRVAVRLGETWGVRCLAQSLAHSGLARLHDLAPRKSRAGVPDQPILRPWESRGRV